MKLGVLIAILGEHGHLRDNLCNAPREESADADHEEREGVGDATTSSPASWPE